MNGSCSSCRELVHVELWKTGIWIDEDMNDRMLNKKVPYCRIERRRKLFPEQSEPCRYYKWNGCPS